MCRLHVAQYLKPGWSPEGKGSFATCESPCCLSFLRWDEPRICIFQSLEDKVSSQTEHRKRLGSPATRFLTPPKGSFIPWSGGPRVCPGMKFSQVEFASVMMTLFRRHKLEPVCEGGETLDMARERLLGLTENSISKLTLQIKNPEAVKLRWVPRVIGEKI